MRRTARLLLVVSFCLGPIAVLALALDLRSAVGARPSVDSLDAARSNGLLLKLKHVLDPDIGHDRLSVSQSELNSAFAILEHAVPRLRGRAKMSDGELSLVVSAEVPRAPIGLWLNLAVSISARGEKLEIKTVRLGRLQLPGAMAVFLARAVGRIAFGEDLIGTTLGSIHDARIRGTRLALAVALTASQRTVLLTEGKALFYALSSSKDVPIVRSYYRELDRAAHDGRLPLVGSFAAYLRFTLELANLRAENGAATAQVRSAILALAIYCGHWRVQYVIGDVIIDDLKWRPSRCHRVSLGGRFDLRQHFIISAALQAVVESGLAYPLGEFKELLDSNVLWGGSGFSFADLAADRAGIHFAARALDPTLTKAERRALVERLGSESSVFPDIGGLPEGLSDTVFERRFGSIKSERYQSAVAAIDERIGMLAFHRAAPPQRRTLLGPAPALASP